ncbi:SDR family NAD(P)-dependent oxidoreductase [Mycolicibacterium hassiacum]|uniref:SDR family NAD(P)-dependent oxidoreductase n=1 Tax=Mycolicibacterium hassiacum TaxID=46351 RepID=UPI0023F92080|nr:SDR family oxidoreductase [Mycolicibacterium hassiacum]
MSRVALVTGGGTGIGAAAAKLLAAKGLDVAVVGRRAELLEAVRAELGGNAIAIVADVGEPDAPQRIVEEVLRAFGRLDVLVNNAAVIQNGPLESFTREVFEQHYAVNVAGPFFLVAAALPALRASPDAAVVNVSSSVASMVKPGSMLYGSTKAALEYLTRAWAYELAADRIRVNCVAPGPVDTPIHATYTDDLEATYADLARRVPLGRMGHVDDVAAWIWFLVAPETAWTTGNVIHVDGGQVLGLPQSAGG